jgi:hypothetical protein
VDEAPKVTREPSPPETEAPPASSGKQLAWLALGLAVFLVLLWFLIGTDWKRFFEDS